MVKLSRNRAVALLTELLRGYSAASFQRSMDKLLEQQQAEGQIAVSEAHVGFLQGRSKLVLQVQREVVVRYGFKADESGILAMKAAIREYLKEGEQEIQRLSREIRLKLRLPELPSDLEEQTGPSKNSGHRGAKDESEFMDFDTPSGSGFFGGRCVLLGRGKDISREETLLGKTKVPQPAALNTVKSKGKELACEPAPEPSAQLDLELDRSGNVSVVDAKKFIRWMSSLGRTPLPVC